MRDYRFPLIAAFVTCLLPALSAKAIEFAGGTGEPNDPYQIATAEQLMAIGQDEGLQGRHFVLVADIDMDPNLPGGVVLTSGLVLAGALDGRGHRVFHLGGSVFVVHPTSRGETHYGVGLFDLIGPDSVVRNLAVEGVFTRAVAPLARENAGCIINCSAAGTLSNGDLQADTIGGLVGKNTGTIVGCSAAVSIVYDGVMEGGGLVGINSGLIMNSSATGNVACGSGLVGVNDGAIVGCRADGDVTYGLGGLVGINSGTIRDGHATGHVQSWGTGTGGLVGDNRGVLHYCHASGSEAAGGLVGSNTGEVSHCFATGDGLEAGLVAWNGGIIAQCYAAGSSPKRLVGVTSPEGIVRSCYAVSRSIGSSTDDVFAIALTDAQMRRQESFVTWDFAGSDVDGILDEWTMPEEGGYPVPTVTALSGFMGAGTRDDPYLIETYPQLLTVSRRPEACYRLEADIDLAGESFSLAVLPAFWGQFDGAGHRISNCTFTGHGYLGFVGTLYPQAGVTDLSLSRIRLMFEQYPSNGDQAVGGLAARNQGTITDCAASVDAVMGSYSRQVGGLVGVNAGGDIRRCSARWSAASGMGELWGGLVGRNGGTVVQCHASSYANGCIRGFGALAGGNEGEILDCYADGYLNGSRMERGNPTDPCVGGLVGENAGGVTRCYAAVVVDYRPAGGGLAGEASKGVVADSYFLSEADGGGPDNGLGVPLSDAQMRSQASFGGWDFDETWSLGKEGGYPRLRWEEACEP